MTEGILPFAHLVAHRVGARHCRRELGRQLPDGVAALLVETVSGRGYRLSVDVEVAGLTEVGLKYHDEKDLRFLDPQVQRTRKRY